MIIHPTIFPCVDPPAPALGFSRVSLGGAACISSSREKRQPYTFAGPFLFGNIRSQFISRPEYLIILSMYSVLLYAT